MFILESFLSSDLSSSSSSFSLSESESELLSLSIDLEIYKNFPTSSGNSKSMLDYPSYGNKIPDLLKEFTIHSVNIPFFLFHPALIHLIIISLVTRKLPESTSSGFLIALLKIPLLFHF